MEGIHVAWAEAESPLGLLFYAATSNGLCTLSFLADHQREEALAKLKQRLSRWYSGPVRVAKEERELIPYVEQVEEYFSKKRTVFDLPIDFYGTSFQQAVWHQLQKIPYGEACSYQQLAIRIGRPKAARAVGRANNQNPIAIVCPCHRVIGADGSLVGYGGGLERKRYLLRHEGWKREN